MTRAEAGMRWRRQTRVLRARAVLVNMVREEYGSCHGAHPQKAAWVRQLTPRCAKGEITRGVEQTILYGRGGTPMPPWAPFMTEAEAGWII